MNLKSLLAIAMVALLAAGCSKTDESKAVAAPAAASGPRVVQLTGNDAMKYNLNTIEAKVGEEFKVTLTNIGTMPKQAMGHNFVVLKAGSDAAAFSVAAAAPAAGAEHIPPTLADQVIAHTKMLGPKEADSVTLKFTEPGEYPYLCSFPAHFQVGMKGVIIVK